MGEWWVISTVRVYNGSFCRCWCCCAILYGSFFPEAKREVLLGYVLSLKRAHDPIDCLGGQVRSVPGICR